MKKFFLTLVLLLLVLVALFFPTIKTATAGVKLVHTAQQTQDSVINYAQHLFAPNESLNTTGAAKLKTHLELLSQDLDNFINQSEKSKLVKLISGERFTQLKSVASLLKASQQLLTGTHTYLILLQNSEEIRATGGFLGSYARLALAEGQLSEFEIQDIYVPDGQFEGFIQAPAGAREYLSGGEGLKLRDANWHPDFPTSAQQVLNYFAWGKESAVEGVVSINLPVVEELLRITGPVYLADYDQQVTADNFSDIARADRGEFFPGSQQKKHFLSVFFNQLLFKLNQLDQGQQQALAQLIVTGSWQKNLQFFSHNSQLQESFEELGIAGQLTRPAQTPALMLLESNVGINKANQHLDRGVKIQLGETESQLSVTFTNHNFVPNPATNHKDEANHLAYVNYQRLILSPNFTVRQLVFNGQKITEWDEEQITNSKGQIFTQIGFLLTVPEQTTRQLKLTLAHAAWNQESLVLFINKQAGLKPTPYSIHYQDQIQSFNLDQDRLVEFK